LNKRENCGLKLPENNARVLGGASAYEINRNDAKQQRHQTTASRVDLEVCPFAEIKYQSINRSINQTANQPTKVPLVRRRKSKNR